VGFLNPPYCFEALDSDTWNLSSGKEEEPAQPFTQFQLSALAASGIAQTTPPPLVGQADDTPVNSFVDGHKSFIRRSSVENNDATLNTLKCSCKPDINVSK
jgi:hypothetical protein